MSCILIHIAISCSHASKFALNGGSGDAVLTEFVSSANQYVIVKSGALHWSYNTGLNTADAVNLALFNHDLEITDTSFNR